MCVALTYVCPSDLAKPSSTCGSYCLIQREIVSELLMGLTFAMGLQLSEEQYLFGPFASTVLNWSTGPYLSAFYDLS